MSKIHRRARAGSTFAIALLAASIHAALAQAPQAAEPPASDEAAPTATRLDSVVVMGAEEIDAAGAISGDELMRSIPQMGDVLFDASNNPQTSNAARGDVNSVNLRSLGVGNTLVLLNGRRLVQHPTSQGTSDTG